MSAADPVPLAPPSDPQALCKVNKAAITGASHLPFTNTRSRPAVPYTPITVEFALEKYTPGHAIVGLHSTGGKFSAAAAAYVQAVPTTVYNAPQAWVQITRVTQGSWYSLPATLVQVSFRGRNEKITEATTTVSLQLTPASTQSPTTASQSRPLESEPDRDPDIVWCLDSFYGTPSQKNRKISSKWPFTISTPPNPFITSSGGVTYEQSTEVDLKRKLVITCTKGPNPLGYPPSGNTDLIQYFVPLKMRRKKMVYPSRWHSP